MKCVAYCRVSKDTSDQLNSLENQIRHYSELFKKKGFEGAECGMYYAKEGKEEIVKYIPAIFADEGISGTKLKNREAFKYMLECAYRKEFDIIYVKNTQRWARSVEDGAGILKKLKVIGVKVIFEDGNINNFDHEMTINILLSTAQEESRAKSAAVQFGIKKAQEQGKFTSAIPYGYRKENGFLKPISEQLEIVKTIFNLYLQGWGGTKISRHLNNQNIPTQKGKRWTQVQIHDVITNPIYKGMQVTHTVQNTDINVSETSYSDGEKEYKYKSIKKLDESDWIVNQIEELRAVSDEVFNEVQEENEKRKELNKRGNRQSNENIFSNLLYCQHCGRAMRRKKLWGWKRKDGTRNFGIEWVCVSHDTYHNDICRFRNSWHEDVLANRIKEEIDSIRNNQEKLDNTFSEYMVQFLSSEDVSDRMTYLEVNLEEINAEIKANLKLYTKNIIDDEQYKEQNDELQTQKKELESELAKLKRIDEAREEAKRKFHNYIKFINKIDLENLDNSLLKRIIKKIEAYTYINDKGAEEKDIMIIWNMLEKSFDDIFYKKAKNL
ncbi:recombinase family protein [Pseudobacteroides cellulosolvens]|uniref:Recombinase n=1 Tax=Pseudobacteroides cellulosolvens ATCC 35603 = DSM 2933 TaxID=398512 RepID=A0A0L6JGC1_9FIRM|nr:recombinase family protein [Pseudobacteroides cellulosolvens]KNY24768.1 Recombinase [Pseudobacteroides cellulosolvens ATCC 35603 = DSM 2933]